MICVQPKYDRINAAIREGRRAAMIARQFRVSLSDLTRHIADEHHINAAPADVPLAHESECTSIDHGFTPSTRENHVTAITHEPSLSAVLDCEQCAKRPLWRLQQAWRDAKDDEAERARMVAWLNEELQSEGMGLE
jgi:hypothetical protein